MDLVAKILTIVILAIITLCSYFLYKYKKDSSISSYLYLTATLGIMALLAFFCFDSLVFDVEHTYVFYYIELGIYLGIILLSNLIMFLIKKFYSKKNIDN